MRRVAVTVTLQRTWISDDRSLLLRDPVATIARDVSTYATKPLLEGYLQTECLAQTTVIIKNFLGCRQLIAALAIVLVISQDVSLTVLELD